MEEKKPVLIQYTSQRRAEALTEAARLRSIGQNVVTYLLPKDGAETLTGNKSIQAEQVITFGSENGGGR